MSATSLLRLIVNSEAVLKCSRLQLGKRVGAVLQSTYRLDAFGAVPLSIREAKSVCVLQAGVDADGRPIVPLRDRR